MDMPFSLKLAVLIIILLAECAWLLKLIRKIGQGLGLLKPNTPPIQTHHWHYPSFDEEAYKQRLKAQYEAELQRHKEPSAEAVKPPQWRDVSPETHRLTSPIKMLTTRKR